MKANEEYLREHKHPRGNQWRHNPMRLEEVDILLSVFIVMGVVGYPTQRYFYTIKLTDLMICL